MGSTSEQPRPPADDKQAMLGRLRISARRFLTALRDLSEEEAGIRAAPNAWSIREVAEHVALAEKGMLAALINGTPTQAEPDLSKDALIASRLPDRTQKQQAPERSRPTGQASLDVAAANFEDGRTRTIGYVEQAVVNLRQVSVKHPLLGALDGYQLLLVMALHPERHILQIDEIKNCAAYRDARRSRLRS
jgi:hypothetical protein